jgi:NAD(P)-dependent dehydrogenase (short-subunit alcohol dehydrogenase family)
MTTFRVTDLPELTGRAAIVTGANGGIGLETARMLSAAGARVVYAVRDTAKGRAAAASATGQTEVRELDLASLDSVRRFARDWDGEISLLICNAGVVMPPSLTRTGDGFETQFGVNHLGHFALTNLLLEHVTGRVVAVSANAHRFGKIDFDDLNWERRPYRASAAYAQSKLANLLFIAELQRRLAAAGSNVLALAAHPGAASTDAITKSGGSEGLLMRTLMRLFAQTPADAALETLYAAVAEIPGGGFIGPGGFMQMSGPPKPARPSKAARDPELARRLWDVSAELTHVQPALNPR